MKNIPPSTAPGYDSNVFINCPFDVDYADLLDAIIFTVHDCGFVAKCALEIDDAGQIRIDKIIDIIRDCKLGIHDISRTEPDRISGLPRFNMPLELGLFIGAKRFGQGKQRDKLCLILDHEPYRYQKYCSDIAGQDIRTHSRSTKQIIRCVRDWLRNASRHADVVLPSGSVIWNRYQRFLSELPLVCNELKLDPNQLIFNDYTTVVSVWLREHSDWE